MRLHLQFGYGMMEHCRHLVSKWGGGTVILSPRDLNEDQLYRLSDSLQDLRAEVMVDPQFYLPHADYDRLVEHDYWPQKYSTGTFWGDPKGEQLRRLIRKLGDLNRRLGTSRFILPGMLAETISDDWLDAQEATVEEAKALLGDRPLLCTLALGADSARDESAIELLIERSRQWDVSGYYLVCEHPRGLYLSDDPSWLANVLDLTAALRLRGVEVIIGYSGHQMLIAACASATAICSGTWLNVRAFPPAKFRKEETVARKATWYYCPQALSEYKIPYLDTANRMHLLDQMAPSSEFDGGYTQALFSGAQPTSIGFSEQAAFRHYLHALRLQVQRARKPTFDETVKEHERLLNEAEALRAELSEAGVLGQQREFSQDVLDANRSALAVLRKGRGALLRRKWTRLG